MNIMLLGPYGSPLKKIIQKNGDSVLEYEEKFDRGLLIKKEIDFIISYRFRHIIPKEIIDFMDGRIINLHISLLPWNRGADPNLWSFLENTPKGVTIHHLDEGVDTGDIIAQKSVSFDMKTDTLSTSYEKLNREIVILFTRKWPCIKNGRAKRLLQIGEGSFHCAKSKKKYAYLLADKEWDTPVAKLSGKALIDNQPG